MASNPWIGSRGPYLPFFLATAASAALGGLRTGLITLISSFLLMTYLDSPGGILHPTAPADPFVGVRFLVAGGFVCYLCELLISARERARKAERRLIESERIYRAIGESIPFGIWIRNPEGQHLYASPALLDLTGLTPDEMSGGGWTQALHPDDEKEVLAQWRQCVRDRVPLDMEMRFRGRDNRWHPVLARGVPVFGNDGGIVCWAGINLDIGRLKAVETELNAQAEELKRSNRDLEQFAFVASHDMREPLRMVNIYTELLLRKMGGDRTPELDQFAGFIREAVMRMERLIQDLLAFSRVIHGELKIEPVDATVAARDALGACEPLIWESGAEVTVDPLPAVMAGRAALSQVFQNLISNAVKYRRQDVSLSIHVGAAWQDGMALFRVDDNGIGFDPQYALKIFKLFARLHGSEHPGTGLGLAICQSIVERYGGRMWAESTPGAGSTFFFTLPLVDSAGTPGALDRSRDP